MYGFVGWLFGWLVDWLFGLLVGCKIHQVGGRKSFKLGIKTIQLEPKIVKMGSKRALGRVLGDLGELLGSSWLQDSFKSPKSRPTDPQRTPQVGTQNRSKIELETRLKLKMAKPQKSQDV